MGRRKIRQTTKDGWATGFDGLDYTAGDRVEIHPGTDLWMRGARYGTVVGMSITPDDRVRVQLDKTGKKVWSGPGDRFKLIESKSEMRENPSRPRAKRKGGVTERKMSFLTVYSSKSKEALERAISGKNVRQHPKLIKGEWHASVRPNPRRRRRNPKKGSRACRAILSPKKHRHSKSGWGKWTKYALPAVVGIGALLFLRSRA